MASEANSEHLQVYWRAGGGMRGTAFYIHNNIISRSSNNNNKNIFLEIQQRSIQSMVIYLKSIRYGKWHMILFMLGQSEII